MELIKEKIKNAHYHKFTGVAPDGFILIPKEVLEELKKPHIWNEWGKDNSILEEMIIKYCNNI
jgi:hypothetical protein